MYNRTDVDERVRVGYTIEWAKQDEAVVTVVICDSKEGRYCVDESKISYIAIEHAFVIQDVSGADLRFNSKRLFNQRRGVVTMP